MSIPNHVILTEALPATLKDIMNKSYSQIAVLVDENTWEFCYPIISPSLPDHFLIRIESGEKNKNLSTCDKIWSAMTDHGMDRKALLINLGGGVIGDMGGFCAATYKRGIDFINIPTTLLAQVDASIGGKLGVDFQSFKNHIGVFRDPKHVLISPIFLNTLDERELRSGFAEVIKHQLIADGENWQKISQQKFEVLDWISLIAHSIRLKEKVVQADPTEKGQRKILNFGHTIGHAIESYYLHTEKRLLHGEAIAIGMICEAYLSTLKTGLSQTDLNSIVRYIHNIYTHPIIEKSDVTSIAQLTLQDKKNEKGIVKMSLLEKIGKATYDIAIPNDEIEDALNYYCTNQNIEQTLN